MLTVCQQAALKFHSGNLTLNEYSMIHTAQSSAGLLNEGMISSAKNAVIDIVQVAAGAGAIVGTGGAGGDTIVDSLIAIETQSETLALLQGIVKATDWLGEIYNMAQGVSMKAGLNSIYKSTEKIMFAVAEKFDDAKGWLDEQRQKILDLIDQLLRSVDKWISAMLPDDAGIGGIVIRETISYVIKSVVENPFDTVKNTIQSRLPDHLRKLMMDERYAIKYFEDITDNIADFMEERQGRYEGDVMSVWGTDSDADSFIGKGYDAMRKVKHTLANPVSGFGSAIADLVGAHPEDLKAKLEAGEITQEEHDGLVDAYNTQQKFLGAADWASPTSWKHKLHGAMFAKGEEWLPGYLRETIKPAIPGAIKTFHFIMALFFGALAALQITIKGDYKKAEKITLSPKQQQHMDNTEEKLKQFGTIGSHPLGRQILLHQMGIDTDVTSSGYVVPSPEELRDEFPDLNQKEAEHYLQIVKDAAKWAKEDSKNLEKQLAASYKRKEKILRENIRDLILRSHGYNL